MLPPEIELIRSNIAEFNKRQKKAGRYAQSYSQHPDDGILRTKPAADWLKQEYGTPEARMLFGSLWFEHELCILFADTNLGKSVLAVQIADNLTRCHSAEPFYNKVDESMNVLYIDFELSSKQFEARYVDSRWGSYPFAPNLYRAEFNPAADDPLFADRYEEYIKNAIGSAVRQTKAQVLIIDNITYMGSGTEQARHALPLMKTLKAIKKQYNLSLLILAHTPKRNPYKPLTVNDLQGSKMLINFADSAFAIGQSHTQPGTRYIKQIKQRNKQEQYGESNVCLIRQQKDLNFLHYAFEGYAHEHDHLCRPETREKVVLQQHMIAQHKGGKTTRDIALELGLHHSTVARILAKGV